MARTQWEELYERVQDDIEKLRIKPGEKISENKLAARYGVSRAPTRNVIQKLREEGFVVVKPQVGTVVLPISEQKAREILQIRSLIEPVAARMAAERITDDDLAVLDQAFSRFDLLKVGTEPWAAVVAEVDIVLHETIWRCCGNREIFPIFNRLSKLMRRIRLATRGLRLERSIQSEHEMRRILAALRDRDPETALEAMRVHIDNIGKAMNPDNENKE